MSDSWTPGDPYAAPVVAKAALQSALELAPTERKHYASQQQQMTHTDSPPALPRFPTGCAPLDRSLEGGFYGYSAIVAPPGLGKSMLAFRTAIEAAIQEGTRAIYFVAEQDEESVIERWDAYQEYGFHRGLEAAVDYLTIVHVPYGWNVEHLVWDFEAAISGDEQRYLLVLDSVNTIADKAPGFYLERLKEFAMLALCSRIKARGVLSWLLISETNARGGAKGGKIDYHADVVLRLKGKKDEGHAELILEKKRNAGEKGSLGKMVKDWQQQTFMPADAYGGPRLATSGGEEIL